MGTTLTGTTPQDTYDSLIKVTDNGPLSGTAKYLSDGLGNDSALALNTRNLFVGTTSAVVNYGRELVVDATALTSEPEAFVVLKGTRVSGNVAALTFRNGSEQIGSITMQAEGNMRFLTGTTTANTSEKMRIGATGNVGIGTSSPAAKLDVNGGNIHSFYNYSGDGSNYNLRVGNDLDSSQFGYFSQLGGSTFVANNTYYASAGQFRPTATATSSISLAEGNIVFSGNTGLTIGTNYTQTERARFTPNGLCFNGDTAAANALDDYEEGDWTPAITFGGGSTGITYQSRGGKYTKVGRQVSVSAYILLSSKGSSAGAAAIEGLPFTIANAVGFYSSASLSALSQLTFSGIPSGYGAVGSTKIELVESLTTGTQLGISNTNFTNGTQILLQFTYFV